MQTVAVVILGLGLVSAEPAASPGPEQDLARLRDVLADRNDPQGQSQAALVLVRSREVAAVKIVSQGLRKPDHEEMFQALAAAVRLRQDVRFLDDLLAA